MDTSAAPLPPPAPDAPTVPTRTRNVDRVTVALCLLALAAAAWSMIGARWLEPHLSINADEYSYVHQAQLLADGKLVVDTPSGAAARSFQPWFAIETSRGYVFKYNPVWPGVLAVGELVGFLELGLGIAAAAFVFGMFFLARQLLDSRGKALAATALTAFAPVTVLQFSSYLSYVWFGAVWTFSAGLLLRGVRQHRLAPIAGSGVLAGVAFASRPYDAVLVLVPFIAWTLWALWKDRPFLARAIGAAALAALPVVVLQLLYNHHVTGSFTTFPFSKWAPLDKLGYGPRGLDPSGIVDVNFHLKQGIAGSAAHLFEFWLWSFGGVVLAIVAVVGLLALRRQPWIWAALGVIVLFPLGYAYFWGGYQIARLGEFFVRFGPYYFLPILVPIGIFAAEGLWQLWSQRRRLTVAALTAMVGFAAFGGTRAFGVVFDERAAREQPYALLARHFDRPGAHALVFLPEPFVGLELPDVYSLDVSASTPVLYASTWHNFDLDAAERFPKRDLYRLLGCSYTYRGQLGTEEVPADSTHLFRLVSGEGGRLQPLHVIDTTELHYRLTVTAATARNATVSIDAGPRAIRAQLVAPTTGTGTVDITVRADSISVSGAVGQIENLPGSNGSLLIRVERARADGDVPTAADPDYVWEAPMRIRGTSVRVLGPPWLLTIETDRDIPFEAQQCRALSGAQLTETH